MKKFIAFLAILCGLLTSCDITDKDYEAMGSVYLQKARTALMNKQFNQAKQAIKEMRDSVPLAIESRKTGILLMDSIELCMAQEELKAINQQLLQSIQTSPDSLKKSFDEACQKIKFYNRKIAHDRKSIQSIN